MLVTGCSGAAKTQQEAQSNNNAAAGSESEKIVVPQEQPALIGKVKEIIGNEVTVYKVQTAGNGGAPNTNSQKLTKQNANQSPSPSAAPSANQSSSPNTSSGVRPNSNQVPGSGNRTAGFKVTEETETFLIPVGTPMVSMQRGANGANSIGLSDIKKDVLLRLWKKDDEINFVQVMGGTSTGTGTGVGAGRTGTAQGAGGNGQRSGNNAGYGGGGAGGYGGMGGNRQQ